MPRILKLQNCERVRRVGASCGGQYFIIDAVKNGAANKLQPAGGVNAVKMAAANKLQPAGVKHDKYGGGQ